MLEPRPGRTADEAAAEARRRAAPRAPRTCAQAARLFDDIWYGGRPAGPEADATLRELDERSAPPGRRPWRRAPRDERHDRVAQRLPHDRLAQHRPDRRPALARPRRARSPSLLVVLLAALVLAVVAGDAGSGRLDPRAPAPSGARAVAEVLRDQGVAGRPGDDQRRRGARRGRVRATRCSSPTRTCWSTSRSRRCATTGADLVRASPRHGRSASRPGVSAGPGDRARASASRPAPCRRPDGRAPPTPAAAAGRRRPRPTSSPGVLRPRRTAVAACRCATTAGRSPCWAARRR